MKSEVAARGSLRELVMHVLAHQHESLPGITYEDLAFRIGRLNKHGVGHGHGMGNVLAIMGHLLKGLEVGWGESIPHIQCMVVQKTGPNKGLPDDGIKEFWPDYPKLSLLEKVHKAQAERERVSQFGSRWNAVLRQMDLSEVTPGRRPPVSGLRGGGESLAHKALKEHVKNNPALVGADATAEVYTEYVLPSLDTVDVLFKSSARWTAVEVKSTVSDGVQGDYERGLYQIVKYTALLEAMRRDPNYSVSATLRVILVLENSLPTALVPLKTTLGITVIDRIKPPVMQSAP